MNAAGKLAAFAVILGGVLGGGAALGAAVGPLDVDSSEAVRHDEHREPLSTPRDADPVSSSGTSHDPGTGPVAPTGYALAPEGLILDGTRAPFRFRITGPGGATVHEAALADEGALHLLVISHDLQTQARLHPTHSGDGTWSAPVPSLAPGPYRAIADFTVAGGPEVTVTVDLMVPQPGQPTAPTEPTPLPTTTSTSVSTGHADHGTLDEEER